MRHRSVNQMETYSKSEIVKSLIITWTHIGSLKRLLIWTKDKRKSGRLDLGPPLQGWVTVDLYYMNTHNSRTVLWKDTTYSHNKKQRDGVQDCLGIQVHLAHNSYSVPKIQRSFDYKGSPTLQQNRGVGTYSLQGFFENTARRNGMACALCN